MNSRAFLILDDSASERQILAHVLGDAFPRADVRQAGDAGAAMELCGRMAFDCVLLDYNMPQVDGIAFAGQLRAVHKHLPLVLVTGVGDELLVAHAIRNGVSDYIPKSRVNVDSIQRTVERAIQSCAQARIIEEQQEELENFAYALAHDFKQPIRQIRTFTQMIDGELEDGDQEGVRQHLAFLNKAARRLSDLVDVMSQYTLLNQAPEITAVTLSAVLDGVRDALSAYLAERNGELVLGESVAEARCRGNETLMAQVLQNLIVNGLKYNKSEIPRVEVSVEQHAESCLIKVQDNGLGIEKQYQTEIFRPLVRLHAAAEYSGTGLGLTLTRKAVAAQGGSIWCESDYGAGSTFYVRMRVPRDAAPASNAA